MKKNMATKQALSDVELKEYEIRFKTLIPFVEHFLHKKKVALKEYTLNNMLRAVGMKVNDTIWKTYRQWLKELGYSDRILYKEAGKRDAQIYINENLKVSLGNGKYYP